MQKPPKIILGIDPGTLLMGYCIIDASGTNVKMLRMDVLKLKASLDNYQRLEVIYATIDGLIKEFKPDCFAIEAPFFGKNVQSMLKLGRAQGVAIAAAIAAGLEVCEYSPRKVKQSITGNGNAGKEQVWKMLQQILLLQETALKYYDASDALAVALCHHFQAGSVAGSVAKAPGRIRDWSAYARLNPGRIK